MELGALVQKRMLLSDLKDKN